MEFQSKTHGNHYIYQFSDPFSRFAKLYAPLIPLKIATIKILFSRWKLIFQRSFVKSNTIYIVILNILIKTLPTVSKWV